MKLFNPFGRKKVKIPENTGRIIDMTKTFWGHNMEVMNWWSDPDDTFHAAIWNSKRPVPGDIIRWKTTYGTAEGIVLVAKSAESVWDMSFVDVKILGRVFDADES